MLIIFLLSGCATLDILEVLFPSPPGPFPVCDSESVGTMWQGKVDKVCLKYSDGSYRWIEITLIK